jgi:PAS domain S-box-containing protein
MYQNVFNELRECYPELNNAFFRLLMQRIGEKDINRLIEEKLKESEQRLHSVIHGSPIPAFVIGKDHRVLYWNKALEELTMIKAEEILGTNQHWRAFYREERPCMADLLVDNALELVPKWYFEKYTKSRLIEEAYEATDFFPTLGDSGKWLRFTAAAIRNIHGDLVGAIETLEDITDRIRAEEELIRVKKLESLGIFSAGVVRDFDNLISVMLRNIFAAKLYITDEQEDILGEGLEIAKKAGLQAKEIAHRLITFARGGISVKKIGSIRNLITHFDDQSPTDSSFMCEYFLPDDLWPVEMDDLQIRQVLHNLVVNAREAMPKGGTITISAKNVSVTGRDSLPLKEGTYVKLRIEDHGIGIPQENLQKIFDPYFTTKPKETARGMGLGLAICYSIVRNHNGCITVESKQGLGSTFFVYLPAVPGIALSSETKTNECTARGGRILVMDDEEDVLHATGVVLKYLGYEVEYTKDGGEAIALYKAMKEKGQPFSAVVLDLYVPAGMGAQETIKKLLEIDPYIKAIIACGYSDDPIVSEFRNYGFSGAVAVPYDLESMKNILNKMLK